MTAYLDWNATAPVLPAARDAALAALALGGNPSAIHSSGRAARKVLEDSRALLAGALDAKPSQVVFTSGATEANNLAIQGLAGQAGFILVSAIEHPSVLEAVRHSGLPFELVPVTREGVVDITVLAERLAALASHVEGRVLIAVMAANNETGVIQPVARIVELAGKAGAAVHCDAVQAFGKTPLSFAALGVDTLSVSAHKIGGPSGVGALLVADNVPLAACIHGGGQERRRRAGTENLAGVAGFAAAARGVDAMVAEMRRVTNLRDELESTLARLVPGSVVFGQAAPRLANTTLLGNPDLRADVQLVALDLAGIAVSAGAACSSGKVEASHVLDAMGAGDLASRAIRISLGWTTKKDEIDAFVDAYLNLVAARAAPVRAPQPRIAVGA